ncbi:MAG TPA: tetratricopeptide repeat protein [candidate division WOR-3 bacterium]|uniref:Tetratricopeptide repeat protein n=1 Tax=candidate division WOR-3 bacterium TaxID=2052148 RepID=A0A7V0T511_UNCW3|nr:tetratricopeptide repeat protein [candidate division WOR-3 bacterium]
MHRFTSRSGPENGGLSRFAAAAGPFLKTPAGLSLVLTAVALIAVAIYLPTIEYGFVWDDVSLIVENPSLVSARPWDLLGQGFWHGATDAPEGPAAFYYRPLATLSFWADLKLAGTNPGWFHLVNAILNTLVALLVVLIVRELLNSTIWGGIAGLLFATHSSHVEAVAFISGRTDLLLTLFMTVAAFGLFRALRRGEPGWYFVVPVGYLFALLSKETAILFPVLVALAPLLTGGAYTRRHWLTTGACLLVGLGWLFLRAQAVGPGLPFPAGVSPLARLTVVANDLGLYLRMFIWPFVHRVKYPADPSFANLTPLAIAALLFLVTMPLLAVRRRYRVVSVGFLWALLFLLPVVNIVPLGPEAAERLLYLPSAGLIIILITLAARGLPGRARLRTASAAFLVLLSLAFATDGILRSRVWRNELRLFSTMVAEAPGAPSPYANLANVIAPTDPDSALVLYYKALSRDQGHIRAHINVGILQSRLGDHRQSVHHFRIANELRPNSRQILNNLGLAFLAAGRADSALVYLNRAVAADAHREADPTGIMLNRSVALDAVGYPDSADAELRRLVEHAPRFVPARLVFADRFERRGRYDSTLHYLRSVLELEPNRPEHHNRLGTVLVMLGDTTAAADHYARALTLNRDFIPALFNQAILTAARGDTAAAVRLAERAWRLRPDVEAIAELYHLLSGQD